MRLDQLRTILWLKFTLFKHTLFKPQNVLGTIALGFTIVGLFVVSHLIAVGLFLGAVLAEIGRADPQTVLFFCDGTFAFLFFFWLASVSAELQRSELVDFRKMLFLPVSLRGLFGLNYAFSLLDAFGIFFAIPWLGLILGLAVVNGLQMLWGIPLFFLFYLTIAAWFYYLRGALAIFVENKRRRRTLMLLFALIFPLVFMLPYSLASLNELAPGIDMRRLVFLANVVLPPLWFPFGLYALAQHAVMPTVLCFAGLAGLGSLALGLGCRSTRRYYLGIKRLRKGATAAGPFRTSLQRRGKLLVERRLPGVDDEIGAIALACWRMMSRHPFPRMVYMGSLIAAFFLAIVFRFLNDLETGRFIANLAPVMAILWPVLSMGALWGNIFGIDGPAFRNFMILPAARWKYLLGKNLALLPALSSQGMVFVGLASWLFGTPASGVAIGVMAIFQVFFLVCMIGNVCSVFFAFPLSAESMRRQNYGTGGAITMLAAVFVLPVLLLPIFLCALLDPFLAFVFDYDGIPIGLPGAALLLLLTAYVYKLSLGPTGKVLQNREGRILDALLRSTG